MIKPFTNEAAFFLNTGNVKTHVTQTHCYGLLVCFIAQGRSFVNSLGTRRQRSKAGIKLKKHNGCSKSEF